MTLSTRVKTQLRAEFEPRVTAYVGTLAVTASVTAVGLVATGYGIGNGWSVVALALVAAVAERGRVHLTSTTEESISLLPTLFAAILFGPLAGMAVGAASLLGEFGQPPYLKWVTYTSSRAIVGAATGLAAAYCLSAAGKEIVGLAIATLVGAIVAELLDVFFAGVAAQLRGNRRLWELLR